MSNKFFREGCPAELTHGWHGEGEDSPFYVDTKVFFQANGQKLTKSDAGKVEPDAVRVVHVDDYEGSTYRDEVYALTVEAAEVDNQNPGQIPDGNVFVLEQDAVASLAETCVSCSVQDECLFLKAALGRTLGIEA